MSLERHRPENCLLCGSTHHQLVQIFEEPLDGENTFGVEDFYRELWHCGSCGLFTNQHTIDLDSVYEGAYRNAAYGGDRIRERFEKIMALPENNSDNRGRAKRIVSYMQCQRPEADKKVLDIGSGMAVFPAAMREAGWRAVAVDPDDGNVANARDVAGVEAIQGIFPGVEVNERFPLITFNKVLEHIQPIRECLAAAKLYLEENGIVYIELPDGEAAIDAGATRQEFFLEHYYIFSATSIALLVDKAGYRLLKMERIRDPSGKYTLAAFMTPRSE